MTAAVISLPGALTAAGYTETSPGHFERGNNDNVTITEAGRVLFFNSDGDGHWRSTLAALLDIRRGVRA